jgi:hypothetical protein
LEILDQNHSPDANNLGSYRYFSFVHSKLYESSLPDGNAEAMVILFNIFHVRSQEIPIAETIKMALL